MPGLPRSGRIVERRGSQVYPSRRITEFRGVRKKLPKRDGFATTSLEGWRGEEKQGVN